MTTLPSRAPEARLVTERRSARPPALAHPVWAERFPWLVQGTTVRADGSGGFDLGLFSDGSSPDVVRRNWLRLVGESGMERVVHARQVHGCDVHVVSGAAPSDRSVPGLLDPADGHLTAEPGVQLAVTAADCVPVFTLDGRRRSTAAGDAGWRGAAAGILERAVATMGRTYDVRPEDVLVHLGPAICGSCYEVGPEVFEALGLAAPERTEPIDLRVALAARAGAAGVPADAISGSTHCTRCGGEGLFSHRGGDRGRHVGYIGIRPDASSGLEA